MLESVKAGSEPPDFSRYSHRIICLLLICCCSQVIVAQMEVYEKSLKEAQRRLLRKAEWGEAVLPQPEVGSSLQYEHRADDCLWIQSALLCVWLKSSTSVLVSEISSVFERFLFLRNARHPRSQLTPLIITFLGGKTCFVSHYQRFRVLLKAK